jgi:hypothetical protein
VWDFSGYNSYSTETAAVNRRAMRFFMESSHYTKTLGAVVVRRMFGGPDASFGALLNPRSIERHLAAIREQRRLYREHREADVRRVRDAYALVASQPSGAAPAAN